MEYVEAETTNPERELSLSEARDLLDIIYLINALLRNGGNISRAAQDLGIGRRTIYDMMDKYNISCAEGRLSVQLTPLLYYAEIRTPYLKNYLT